MSKKWYGSLNNRLDENKMYCEKIEVGTGMTEYYYSDRHAYEVVKVVNQEDVFVRRLDHIKVDNATMSNSWKLVSNPNNPIREIKKYRGRWCWVVNYTKENIKNCYTLEKKIYDKVMETGKATRYVKANVSFGVSEYYFDYEF